MKYIQGVRISGQCWLRSWTYLQRTFIDCQWFRDNLVGQEWGLVWYLPFRYQPSVLQSFET